jgi:DNA (cytosine-5)-methyltransferase 1
MFRLIKELRPTWVIGENVGGHIKLGLDTVLENLESEGYSARTFSISATSIGANHKRERVWIIANLADTERLGRTEGTQKSEELEREESSDKPDNCGQGCTKCQSCQTVANSDEMQRQYLRGQESEQTQKTFERTSERSGTQNGMANSEGSERNVDDPNQGDGKTSQEELSREYGSACGVGTWWSVEPDVGRVAHGIPDRVDRLKCLGNSVVPQIPYVIGLSLKKIIENNE